MKMNTWENFCLKYSVPDDMKSEGLSLLNKTTSDDMWDLLKLVLKTYHDGPYAIDSMVECMRKNPAMYVLSSLFPKCQL
jgi:hypothetical protein